MKDVYAYKFGDNLYINLTNRCCNACKFCIRTHGDTVNGEDNLWLSKLDQVMIELGTS